MIRRRCCVRCGVLRATWRLHWQNGLGLTCKDYLSCTVRKHHLEDR